MNSGRVLGRDTGPLTPQESGAWHDQGLLPSTPTCICVMPQLPMYTRPQPQMAIHRVTPCTRVLPSEPCPVSESSAAALIWHSHKKLLRVTDICRGPGSQGRATVWPGSQGRAI